MAEDEVESVSGTLGLTGGADAILVLRRQRESKCGTLFITGRDVEERKIQLDWNPEHCLWSVSKNQDDPESSLAPEQRRVLSILRTLNKPVSIMDINASLKKDYEAAARLIRRMATDGLLKKHGYGLYELPLCPTMSDCPTDENDLEIPDFWPVGQSDIVGHQPGKEPT